MTGETTARDLAIQLVESFGDPDAMAALLTDDIDWWVTPTATFMDTGGGGREAMVEVLGRIFTKLYVPGSVNVVVHSALGEGNTAALRLTLTAETRRGTDYVNDYAFWVETRGDRICKVWEYFDVAHTNAQLRG